MTIVPRNISTRITKKKKTNQKKEQYAVLSLVLKSLTCYIVIVILVINLIFVQQVNDFH